MNPQTYYATPSPITDPGDYAGLLANLPRTLDGLCGIVQNVCLHYMRGEAYGYKIPEERLSEVNLRHMTKMLARLIDLDARPLAVSRPSEKRLIGCCRDTAVLFCAMARAQGIPARVRVGFAGYFTRFDPDFYCSHVIAEIWDADEHRWQLVDPQLDDLTIQENNIPFDICDIPRDQFLVGGKAWQLCRTHQAAPNRFGVSRYGDMKGLLFVRGNLVQDLAALNKMELLNWDCWGLMLKSPDTYTDQEWELLDRVAVLTQADDDAWLEMHTLYESEAGLKVPDVIMCYNPVGAPSEVTISI